MSLYYFDTSALVKRYVAETGSTWVRELIERVDPHTDDRINIVVIAEISIVEMAAALAIISRIGRIPLWRRDREYRRFMSDVVHLYRLIPVTTADFYAAAHLTQGHPLRAYDAVQLAVALRHQQALAPRDLSLIFVSGDGAQLRAAEAEGLLTENPFDHPAPTDVPSPSSGRSQ